MADIDYSSTLNEEGLDFIVERYKTEYNHDVKYTYIEEKGIYVFVDSDTDESLLNDVEALFSSGKVVGYCADDETLGSAITKLDEQANGNGEDDSLNGTSVDGSQRGTSRYATSTINLNIDPEEFTSYMDKISTLSESAPDPSKFTSLGSNLTGELASYYGGSGAAKTCEAKHIKEYVSDLSLKVKYCCNLITDTDDSLKLLLKSVIDDMFSLGYSKEFASKSLEEKEKELNDIISTFQETLDELKEQFERIYGKGIEIDYEKFMQVVIIFEGLGIVNDVNIMDMYGGNEPYLDYKYLSKIVSLCENQDLLGKVTSFLNGASYESTLGAINISDESYDPVYIKEWLFLDNLQMTYEYYDYTGSDSYDTRDVLINLLTKNGAISEANGKYQFNESDFFSKAKESVEDYRNMASDISTYEYAIRELKKEIKLLSYEDVKDNKEYWAYLAKIYDSDDITDTINKIKNLLSRDFQGGGYSVVSSEYDEVIPYMTQEEFALLNYYLDNNPSKAEGYLKTIQDTLNQRKGYDDACREIQDHGGVDVFSAFFGGLEQFGDNVASALSFGDEPISAANYKSMFILQLLETAKKPPGQRGIYEEILKDVSVTDAWSNKLSYTLFNQIGNMAIPMIAGGIAGKLLVGASATLTVAGHSLSTASLIGSGLVGLGAAGSAMASANSRGDVSRWASILYGTLNGLSEAGLSFFLSKIPGIGGTADETVKELMSQGWKGILKGVALNSLGEAKEEFLQAFVENYLNHAILGDTFSFSDTLTEASMSAFYGFLTSALMMGGSITFSVVINGVKTQLSGDAASIFEMLKSVGYDLGKLTIDTIKSLGISTASAESSFSSVSLESALLQVTTQDGQVDIPAETLANYDISMKKGEKLYYNQLTNEFYRVAADGTVTIISNDAVNNPNSPSRIVKRGDVYVDQVTGREYSVTKFDNDSNRYEHILRGNTTKKGKAQGGHQYMLAHPEIYEVSDVTVDPETGVATGTWNYVGSDESQAKTDHNWFPESWDDEDIVNAINEVVSNSDPVAIHLNKDGKAMYYGVVNGVPMIVIIDNGQVDTAYPVTQKQYDDYMNQVQWVDIR